MSRIVYVLGVSAILSGLALASQAQGQSAASEDQPPSIRQQCVPAPPTDDAFTEDFIGDLTANGFEVSQGYSVLYTQQDCYDNTYPVLKNCFQANPAAPYVLPVVKLWPEEYVDPASVNAFVETDPGYSATYRLGEREAIVIYGKMPPPGRYMGLQTWEFSEAGTWQPEAFEQWANTPDLPFPMQYLFTPIPPDDTEPDRIITLSALGDVVNNAVMEQTSGYPFGEIRYFIITPSASTDQAIREKLQAQGVPDNHIFTEQIPSEDEFGPIGPIGLDRDAIDFFTAFRYAAPDPDYQDAAESWRADPPLNVLRVRAPDSVGPVERYGSLVFAPRTANSEEYLADDLQTLVEEVCTSVRSQTYLTSADCGPSPPPTSYLSDLVRDYGWVGPYCRDIGMDCLGDQQEAAYSFSTPRPTGSGEVYAVISPLATETGNATYVGLSANDASIMGGVPNGTLLDTQLQGSADVYASTVENADKFFVHYYSDDCTALASVPGGEENCTEISGMSTQGDPALQDQIIISLRNYIAPGTTSGPDASQLLTPRILAFTKPTEPGPDDFTKDLMEELEQSGFQVNQGYPMVYSLTPRETCRDYTYPVLNSCLGANPAAPYVIAVMKSWPDESVDPRTADALGPVVPGYSPTYRLDPREAIVIYGEMPPPGRYMGLQTWVWSQQGHWKDEDYEKWANMPNQPFPISLIFSTMPPTDPTSGRVFSFSSLGDIINNVVMERQSGDPFGQKRYFIITPSETTNQAVRSALQARGVDDSEIFTEPIPSKDDLGPIEPLGMSEDALDFTTWFRYAIPDSGQAEAAQKWRSQPPLTVLRVRAPDSLGPVERYRSLTFEPRTAQDESYLKEDMQNLIDAVCERATTTSNLQSTDCSQLQESSLLVDPVGDYGWTGPYCREIGMNCDGDQNDAAYYFSQPLPIDSGQVHVAIGTLATETGNATYVGLGVNDASTFYAPANLGDMTLKGSADGYAETVENTGKFYVHFFTRDCRSLTDQGLIDREQDCTEIDEQMVPMKGDENAPGDPDLFGIIQIGLRDYVAQGTTRGADSSQLITPRVLTFTQP